MARVKQTLECNACGAIYDDLMPDGSEYYHACPDYKVVGPIGVKTPIANRRNENIVVVGRDVDFVRGIDRAVVQIKSAGAGVKPGVRIPIPVVE